MDLGTAIAETTMTAAAKIVNARNIKPCDAGRLCECLRQVLRADLDEIMTALKDAAFMGEAMARTVLTAECTTAAIKAVDLYQAQA